MVWKEVLGFVGGALIAVSFVPQVWRLFKLKSAHEISLLFTLLTMLGCACWLSYGASLTLAPVIFWNAITFGLVCAILYAKLKYGK